MSHCYTAQSTILQKPLRYSKNIIVPRCALGAAPSPLRLKPVRSVKTTTSAVIAPPKLLPLRESFSGFTSGASSLSAPGSGGPEQHRGAYGRCGCNCGCANSAQPQVTATHNRSTQNPQRQHTCGCGARVWVRVSPASRSVYQPHGGSHSTAGPCNIISSTRRFSYTILSGGVRTHGGVRGHVPRPLMGFN